MNIASINIRGLGVGLSGIICIILLGGRSLGLCIQETKMVNVNNQQCYLWGSNEISWVHRSVELEGGHYDFVE